MDAVLSASMKQMNHHRSKGPVGPFLDSRNAFRKDNPDAYVKEIDRREAPVELTNVGARHIKSALGPTHPPDYRASD
jgi:hypothetical protein